MDFTLLIRSPNFPLTHRALPAQGILRIGREDQADPAAPTSPDPTHLALPDTFLSRAHLEILCDHGVFTLTDLTSRNGTLLNGVGIPPAPAQFPLRHGDTLYAGRTALRLSALLDGKPAAPFLAPPPPDLPSFQQALHLTLQAQTPFALLDAAIDPAVLALLKRSAARFQSLYEGLPALDLAPFGPFLVDLASSSLLLPHLIHQGWDHHWGVFLATPASFEDLRRHLRKFLLVTAEDGRQLLFRFYDPRVLAPFLRTSTPAQRQDLFGPITHFLTETPTPNHLLTLTPAIESTHPSPA